MTEFFSSNIIGNNKAKQELSNALASNNIPHSWLISGIQSIGKNSLVLDFVQELFKNIPNAKKRMLAGTLSDFMYITSDSGKDIPIQQIREIGEFLSLTSAESKYRVVIVDGAEKMNRFAANALLKILEEPPKNAIIFLISHNVAKILPTIKSRCIHLKMKPVVSEDCEGFLDQNISNKIYELASGAPGMLTTLVEKQADEIYFLILEIIYSKKIHKIFEIISKYKLADENWEIFKAIIVNILHNIVKVKININNLSEIELEKFQKIIDYFNLNKWFKIYDDVQKIFKDVDLLNLEKKHTIIIMINMMIRN